MDGTPRPSSLWWWLIAVCAGAAVALVTVVLLAAPWDDAPSRQAVVEANGAGVMPFDQEQTNHVFTKSATGGTETVRVLPGAAPGQVGLIRMHLAHEQQLFAGGDFSDPMAVHGHRMPGVRALARSAAAEALVVGYVTVPGGAQLEYRSADPAVVHAVHTWFDAQLRDHGSHAAVG